MRYSQLPFAKAPNGICRWCGKSVPSGRTKWCGIECIKEFDIRNNAGSARYWLFERDDGTCARCGIEAGNIERMLNQLWSHEYYRDRRQYRTSRKRRNVRKELRKESAAAIWIHQGWTRWLQQRGFNSPKTISLWEADHIIPVIKGGGACGLENYQTLCVPCHKSETAELAARRAKERRALKAKADMPLFRRGN